MANNKFCPECGAPNVNGGKFCTQCGAKFPTSDNTCPACGATLSPDSAFCASCGTRVAAHAVPVVHSEPIPSHTAPEPTHQHSPNSHETVVKDGTEYTVEKNGMLTRQDSSGVKYVEAGSFFAAQFAEREQAAASEQRLRGNPAQERGPQPPAWETMNEGESQQPVFDLPHASWEKPCSEEPEEAEPWQPLWDPRAESTQSMSQGETNVAEENPKMAPLDYLQSIKAPKGDDGTMPVQESIPTKHKKNKKQKRDNVADEITDDTDFQATANADGYYNDRRPYDYDSFDDYKRKIQWVPLILGVVGIVLFAFVVIQLSQYL